MAARWKLMIVIAFSVMFLDQWTKFLAVKHLTPGLQEAHAAATGERIASPDDISFGTALGYFYGDVEGPCDTRRPPCGQLQLFVGKWWGWQYAENPGAAFSFLAKVGPKVRVPFFLCVSVIAICMILWFFKRLEPDQKLLMLALSLVMGGAIGNLIDRARLTYVIDFIVWFIGTYRWPTFNIADSAISTGVGMMILDSILDYVRTRRASGEGEGPKSEEKPASAEGAKADS